MTTNTRGILAGDMVRHFKAEMSDRENEYIYLVMDTRAIDTTTGKRCVIYSKRVNNFIHQTFVRPYSEFFSKVDKKKYPNVKQKYRFEKVEGQETKGHVDWMDLDISAKDYINAREKQIREMKEQKKLTLLRFLMDHDFSTGWFSIEAYDNEQSWTDRVNPIAASDLVKYSKCEVLRVEHGSNGTDYILLDPEEAGR